jgi:thiol-disulfide isomerase/thioredoxin
VAVTRRTRYGRFHLRCSEPRADGGVTAAVTRDLRASTLTSGWDARKAQRVPRRLLVLAILVLAACKSRAESPPPAPRDATVATPHPEMRSIDPPAAPGAMAPYLRAGADGVLATWLEPVGEDAHRLRLARWANGAWSAPTTIVEGTRIVANWADVPSIAQAGDGALVAQWAERSGGEAYAYDAVVARSIDDGATWKRLGALHDDGTPTEHGFVSLLGEAERVRAVWLDGRATATGGAMTLRTATVAETIAADEAIDDRVCDCCGTAAVATADGAVVAYRDRSTDEIRDIAAARLDASGWSVPHPVNSDGWQIAGCPVNGPALAARDGRVAIAWYTYADSMHRVRAAFSDDGGATFARPIDVDVSHGGRAPLGRVSIALADDDAAIVGWLASEREAAAVLVRRVRRDGKVGGELQLGANLAGRDAGFPRIALAGDALVVVWTQPGKPSRLRAVEVPVAAIPDSGTVETRASGEPLISRGSPAPPIDAMTMSGAPASLAALRGQVVLINLWATWCEPCRHELPVLATLHERDAARGLTIVAINVDRKRSRGEIESYVSRRKLPFAVWLDPDDHAAAALGAAAFPFNVLIGRDGKVVWSRAGAIRAEDPELRAALDAALAQ